MTAVLIAGVGNVFHGDDGFGVEVARRLARLPLAPGVWVEDYGIRALHLAYALLDPPALLIVADAVARGEAPGTLYLIEADGAETNELPDAHGMSLSTVFTGVRALGGIVPRVLVVGCEPVTVDESMALSEPVARAIEPAVALIQDVLARELPVIMYAQQEDRSCDDSRTVTPP